METIQVTKKENYAIVKLDRGKANAMNLTMVKELREAIAQLKNDPAVKGVILTGKERFFSAGLDVIELFQNDEAGMKDFWANFMGMTQDLAEFHKPLVASITGHSPAGGCVAAICCDYRVMAEGNYTIGLNEVPVGIAVPDTIFNLYAFWIGKRHAYQYLIEGKLMSPGEAFNIGLVDELVPDSEVLARAEAKLKHYLKFESGAWQKTKANLRKELFASFRSDPDKILKDTLEQWWSPGGRMAMQMVVSSLKK